MRKKQHHKRRMESMEVKHKEAYKNQVKENKKWTENK